MQAFLIIIGIVWGILCLVLFFKVWGACNDIADIRKHIINSNQTKQSGISNSKIPITPPTTEDNQIAETTEEPDGLPLSTKIVLSIAVLIFLILIITVSTNI